MSFLTDLKNSLNIIQLNYKQPNTGHLKDLLDPLLNNKTKLNICNAVEQQFPEYLRCNLLIDELEMKTDSNEIIFSYQGVIYYFCFIADIRRADGSIKQKNKMLDQLCYIPNVCKYVSLRYSTADKIRHENTEHICGYLDFLQMFEINITEQDYTNLFINKK